MLPVVIVRGSFLDSTFQPTSQSGRIFNLDQFMEKSDIFENIETRFKTSGRAVEGYNRFLWWECLVCIPIMLRLFFEGSEKKCPVDFIGRLFSIQ